MSHALSGPTGTNTLGRDAVFAILYVGGTLLLTLIILSCLLRCFNVSEQGEARLEDDDADSDRPFHNVSLPKMRAEDTPESVRQIARQATKETRFVLHQRVLARRTKYGAQSNYAAQTRTVEEGYLIELAIAALALVLTAGQSIITTLTSAVSNVLAIKEALLISSGLQTAPYLLLRYTNTVWPIIRTAWQCWVMYYMRLYILPTLNILTLGSMIIYPVVVLTVAIVSRIQGLPVRLLVTFSYVGYLNSLVRRQGFSRVSFKALHLVAGGSTHASISIRAAIFDAPLYWSKPFTTRLSMMHVPLWITSWVDSFVLRSA